MRAVVSAASRSHSVAVDIKCAGLAICGDPVVPVVPLITDAGRKQQPVTCTAIGYRREPDPEGRIISRRGRVSLCAISATPVPLVGLPPGPPIGRTAGQSASLAALAASVMVRVHEKFGDDPWQAPTASRSSLGTVSARKPCPRA